MCQGYQLERRKSSNERKAHLVERVLVEVFRAEIGFEVESSDFLYRVNPTTSYMSAARISARRSNPTSSTHIVLLDNLDKPRKVELGIQCEIMHVGDEGGHLFLEILELFIITRLAHGVVVVPRPLILVVILVLAIILVGGVFIVRPGVETTGESVILDLTSDSGFDIPGVRFGRGPVGGGRRRFGTRCGRVELDLGFVVGLDEMGDLTFERGDLGRQFVGLPCDTPARASTTDSTPHSSNERPERGLARTDLADLKLFTFQQLVL